MGLLCGKENQPLVWQCFLTLSGTTKHSTKTPTLISRHLPQHTVAIPLGSTAPIFDSRVLPKMTNGLVVRQGEPTISVAVFPNIVRDNKTQHKDTNTHFKTPATTHCGHTSWVNCPHLRLQSVAKNDKWACCAARRTNH